MYAFRPFGLQSRAARSEEKEQFLLNQFLDLLKLVAVVLWLWAKQLTGPTQKLSLKKSPRTKEQAKVKFNCQLFIYDIQLLINININNPAFTRPNPD